MSLRNVWRVGANWDGQPILDVFFDYEVAFFGKDSQRLGNYNVAKPGDLLAVANPASYTIVAIAEMLTYFKPLDEIGTPFSRNVLNNYGGHDTVGCRARFYLLPENDRHNCSDYKRFYSMGQDSRINDLYEKLHNREEKGAFDIKPRTETLFKSNSERIGLFSSHVRYRIPIFQRPYSWGQNEISKFIENIFAGFEKNENKFIGTMQLSEPIPLDAVGQKLAYDVIDGQQRITTLILMFQILKLKWRLFQNIDFSTFLRTGVNRGEAQKALDMTWSLSIEDLQTCDTDNFYLQNMKIIFEELKQRMSSDENGSLEEDWSVAADALEKYLKESVLLVVIQTNAGLSKTLEIFNIINTTGLDLNGSDIFKIRFYEFLTSIRGEDQEIFDKVSELYEEIDRRNRTGRIKTSMAEILEILQPIIIGKYGLNLETMNYAADRFFNELFDELLDIKHWENFKKEKIYAIIKDKNGPLSIEGIMKLIELRYDYGFNTEMPAKSSTDGNMPDLKSAFFYNMMFESRYPRFWFYPIIFKYRFNEYYNFTEELSKLSIVYSLINAKSVYHVRSFIQGLCRLIFEEDATAQSVLETLQNKKLEAKDKFKYAILYYEIAWNRKWKNITCRLSEFLTYYQERQEDQDFNAYYYLFIEPMDIEHIQSYHHENDEIREEIWEEWKDIINGIGNLVMLESNINRSIKNKNFSEKVNSNRNLSYHKSRYKNVQELTKLSNWTKVKCEERRDTEADKLINFLFDNRNLDYLQA